jgi:glycosyltransferase involved in cell wall biosynthesis
MLAAEEHPPRRVLIIAYYFPPMGLSGVQRTLKFAKYLPLYGWHPTVLTVDPGGYLARDESLLLELEGKPVRVERTNAAGPARILQKKEVVELPPEWLRKTLSRISDALFIPDNKIGWKRKALARALELHSEHPFDLVFATAPPFTDLLVGRALKNRIARPLVFDYRDPWVDYPFKFYPTPVHKWLNVVLERKALRASSHVVTTNRRVKEQLLRRYRFLTYHDVEIISQGYDPEDLTAAREILRTGGRAPRDRSKMRITYAGVFWEDRVPDHFLRALHELLQERPSLHGRIEAVFVGKFRAENKKLVTRLGLQDSVTVLEYLPHQECIAELMQSDVLWMIVGDTFGSPGKVYEYIGIGKPILGCVPEGFVKQAIDEARGKTVGPRDVPGIKKALLEFFEQFQRGELRGPSPDVIERYDRVKLAGSLVRVFESLLEP